MSSLFGSPKVAAAPAPIPPPPPPIREDAQATAESNAAQLARRRGRAASVLTDGEGTALGGSSTPSTAAARVLGS